MVLTSKARQLLPLGARRPVNALADVSVGLLHPSGNRLRGRLELTRQLLGRASGSHQIDHLSPELRRISGSIAGHQTPQESTSRVSTKPGQLHHTLRVHLQAMDNRAQTIQTKPAPAIAGTKHLGGRHCSIERLRRPFRVAATLLLVPHGYTSGSLLSGSATFSDARLAWLDARNIYLHLEQLPRPRRQPDRRDWVYPRALHLGHDAHRLRLPGLHGRSRREGKRRSCGLNERVYRGRSTFT